MRLPAGRVFSLAQSLPPVPGCTVSQAVLEGENGLTCFSLARGTDISPERYPNCKLLLGLSGTALVYGTGEALPLGPGEALITAPGAAVGVRTEEGAIYAESAIRRSDMKNEAIPAGAVFRLADLVPYQEGRIVNMDVFHGEKMKFALMAFAPGTGLTPHAAPGEALVLALDGQAVITYEGTEHLLRAGEEFAFARGGVHAVRAEGPFKMALLLTLD